MDRLDYVSMMCNEHAYVMAIEKLLGIEVAGARAVHPRDVRRDHPHPEPPAVARRARRWTCGAMTMFLYAFREREDLMDCYEAVSGARMHAAYYRPGGVYRDLPDRMPQYKRREVRRTQRRCDALNENRQGSLLDFIDDFTNRFPACVDEYETLLTDNRIWKQRTGRHRRRSARARAEPGFHRRRCCAAPASPGTCARSSPTRSTTGWTSTSRSASNGDCYDRYLVRMEEMRQSNRIITQCVEWLRDNPGPVIVDDHKVAPPSREDDEVEHGRADPPLQALHRRHATCPTGEAYAAVEHPKGEFGIYLVSRRRQQALPAEDPRAGLSAPGSARRDGRAAT
jgi:NADH-quinone oxidoreductase subunit D